MSCEDTKCTCKATPKGQAMLVRYRLEGDKMLEDPEIQAALATMRKEVGGACAQLPDANLLEVLMRVLARKNGVAA